MAEALGTLSVLTLLEQTIETISRLRALRTFIKSAPGELQDLIEEIEVVQAVLMSLRPEAFEFLGLESTERRLQAFRKDLESLISVITKYKLSAASQRLGYLRLALKKETLRIHRQNLDSLKSTLLLLQQAYCSASLHRLTSKNVSNEALKQRRSAPMTRSEGSKWNQTLRDKKCRQNHAQAEYSFRFMDKLWSIRVSAAYTGWTFTFQINNPVPFDSAIFCFCQDGDIEGAQRLFSEGKASPFDCDIDGLNLLHIAACRGHIAMCRMLLAAGADPARRDCDGLTPLRSLSCIMGSKFNFGASNLIAELYGLFIDEAEDELFTDFDIDPIVGFNGRTELFTEIQSRSFHWYSDLPLQQRFGRAMALGAWFNCGPNPAAIQLAMGGGEFIDPNAFQLKTSEGDTLLHKIAEGLGTEILGKRPDGAAHWRSLLHEAISASANLNSLSTADKDIGWKLSPLTTFLSTSVSLANCESYFAQLTSYNNILRLWLSELKQAGVNLRSYGEGERALCTSGNTRSFIRLRLSPGSNAAGESGSQSSKADLWCRILDLKYGCDPEDWHIYLTNPIDELAGDFWESVDKGLEVMPGTWID